MSDLKSMGTKDRLKERITQFTRLEGDHQSEVPGLSVHIRKAPTEPLHCVYTLRLTFLLQGAKQLQLDNQLITCESGQTMLTTFDLPVISHVTSASRHEPFIALTLTLNYSLILEACTELGLGKPPKDIKYQPLASYDIDDGLTDALDRLFSLRENKELMHGLLPLIEKEIIIRLLLGPHGLTLRHLASAGSPNSSIVKVVSWLKQNFNQSVGMDELADRAHMSQSNFRQHFKKLTGTSPLQYLKTLRLQEARDQMLINGLDASHASNIVGYESASQFSREYSRLFGASPQKDIKRLKGL